jgi:pSer/pThr/pTyr-binding forkhead associated (FHA) protein
MKARIRVITGPMSGQTIDLSDGTLLIGREADCRVRLPCDFVSRHHCALQLTDLTLRIRDLGSKNGTYVNGRRIGTSESILLQDDLVAVGTTSFLIDLVQALAPLPDTRLCDTGTVDADPAPQKPPEKVQESGERVDRATD